MASLTDKTVASVYKDLLHVGNSGNGIGATQIHVVEDGNGTNSSLQVGKRGTIIEPSTDTVSTFVVKDADSNAILTCRSSDDQVLAGSSQSNAVSYTHLTLPTILLV